MRFMSLEPRPSPVNGPDAHQARRGRPPEHISEESPSMHQKRTDGAAELDENGKPTNARLHEELTEGVDDYDIRMHTRQALLASGVPAEVLDRVLAPAASAHAAADPLETLRPLYVVQERDIDLLLLEELHSNGSFVEWFGQRMSLQSPTFDNAWYSVCTADGESDLLLRVRVGRERVGVLIEDKIAAIEQPEQDERYHRRGEQAVKDGWFDRYLTCICAPQEYLAGLPSNSRYDSRVEYEAIADWFSHQHDARSRWRSDVIRAAISQGRKGYVKQVNPAVSEFHLAYYARLQSTQPNLQMARPTPKGSGGTWIILWVAGWPKRIHLNHKLWRGSVELGFERNTREQLVALGVSWPDNVVPITTGKYGSLAINVPAIDVEQPFATQLEAVDAAFAAMQALIPFAQLIERLP